jgi:hypothetical protein
MNQELIEECPVCWRSFSSELVPITIFCGHSFCRDCCNDLRKCPLCRKKLQTNYSRVTNYSLLSLVNKLEHIEKKETKDQEIQTEKIKRPYTPSQTQRLRGEPTSNSLALTVILKLSKVQDLLARTFRLNSNTN